MLILICGLPRAGKTTYSVRYKDVFPVLHLDERGYWGISRKVSTLSDAVVEGVYNTAEQRKKLLQNYNGIHTKCYWLNTPTEVKKTRWGYSTSCEYPFEPPTTDEGWDEVITIE